jgi:hypothetical protein
MEMKSAALSAPKYLGHDGACPSIVLTFSEATVILRLWKFLHDQPLQRRPH